ncbi:hypothetical protein COLO4_27779 [Corchorus olitorius]|uniref:Pentacotripeptide-repeat region of PRORP domain-containing protein n=1 Tax=Corchorus olitorius TaxID=93759 RepID=A0A1R3HPQ8_9ROSI|nr:hypothetical protein COLO4_27779 [Corchorus olitorius]
MARTRMGAKQGSSGPKWNESIHIYCGHLISDIIFTVKYLSFASAAVSYVLVVLRMFTSWCFIVEILFDFLLCYYRADRRTTRMDSPTLQKDCFVISYRYHDNLEHLDSDVLDQMLMEHEHQKRVAVKKSLNSALFDLSELQAIEKAALTRAESQLGAFDVGLKEWTMLTLEWLPDLRFPRLIATDGDLLLMVSIAKLVEEEPSLSHPLKDPVFEILSGLKRLGFWRFLAGDDFKNLVSSLNQLHVDKIVDFLRVESPDSAVVFFDFMRNEYRFRHSKFSRFVVAHVLAGQRRFDELRFVLEQLVKEEGSGSAPSLCELLLNGFRDWDKNSWVWDMLAFAYSRSEMVHDALYVLAKMKDLKLHATILTYNSLLYNLRHTDFMWDVYNEIKVTGTTQSKQTNSIIIDGLCGQSRLQDAVSFLQETEGKGLGLSVVSFNTIMSRYCKLGFADVAKSFFCMMLKYGLFPDAYSYNILIHGLCIAGSMEEALEFSNDMEKHGVEPDIVTYNILTKGFRLLGLMNGAWKVIQRMLYRGLNPDLVTYTILICGYCQTGNVKEALKLWQEMLSHGFQLSVFSYSVLLSSLCKSGQVNEAVLLLYEMEGNGLEPDHVTYAILIHGLCKQGEVQRALRLYKEMCSKRIIPNSISSRAILLSLCEEGMILEARRYFDSLMMNNWAQDIVLYNIMIDGYVKHGNIEEALELYELISTKGITPTTVTFNSLIHGFCKRRNFPEARRLMDAIRLHGLEPTAVTYTTLLNAYCEDGNMHSMIELLQEMDARCISPTHVTYTVLIKGQCKQRRLQEAVQLLKDMRNKGLNPDQVTYNTIIQCFCRASNIKRALKLVNDMLLNNLEPTPVTYNILINCLCVYGKLKDADKLLSSLQEKNVSLTKVAYTTIIKAHCVKGDVHRAFMIFCLMVEKGFEISVRDYSAVINRLCKRCLISEARYFYRMMLSYGISPDQEICEVLLNAYHQSCDYILIYELLASMIKLGLRVS